MTLHRRHHGDAPVRGALLSLKDQLDLQEIVIHATMLPDFYTDIWTYTPNGVRAVNVLQRHGVSVSLDEHTGRITFNPEVIDT